ncbi:gluconokinase [Trinickia fusca]|uniref:Gluconokinase n=1 Tax=Trinickia fusca TaxID=2419777 RepID=A0A494XJQ5_9BURK|nr:gluconokinase [Trinickia fusca]RKP50957.1 gluconokinase [Trinickia fusca]
MHPSLSALVVMGVAGCGKTSIAHALAASIGGRFIEGDAFHPAANVEKMTRGIALTDGDRIGWLDSLAAELARAAAAGERPVLACSALKRRYRDRLRASGASLGFVYLEVNKQQALTRMAQRSGHFMPVSLVDSQFADLEPPAKEPLTLSLDASHPVDAIVARALAWYEEAGPATQFVVAC